MWNHEWGLIISHFVSVPFIVSGLVTSNSAENAWWAHTGAVATSRRTAAVAMVSLVRIETPSLLLTCSRFLRGCFGGSLLFSPNSSQRVRDAVVSFVTGMF